jgi:hypothetical protein
MAFRVRLGANSTAASTREPVSFYRWADDNGVTGLRIHNYLGGTKLYQINPGVHIAAIYGNGVDW